MIYTYEADNRATNAALQFATWEEAASFGFATAVKHEIPLQKIQRVVGPDAAVTGKTMHLPDTPHGRNAAVVLHELAHIKTGASGHGTEWFWNYHYLVKKELSFTMAVDLLYEVSRTLE